MAQSFTYGTLADRSTVMIIVRNYSEDGLLNCKVVNPESIPGLPLTAKDIASVLDAVANNKSLVIRRGMIMIEVRA